MVVGFQVLVPVENILGKENKGFQVRLNFDLDLLKKR